MKDPQAMTASELNRAIESNDKKDSTLTTRLIEAGFGQLRMSEIVQLDHPLAREIKASFERGAQLHREVERRVGPGYHRVPRGYRFR